MDTPVAGQIEVGDVEEKERRVGWKAGEKVVVKTQSLEAWHISEPFPGKRRQEVSI